MNSAASFVQFLLGYTNNQSNLVSEEFMGTLLASLIVAEDVVPLLKAIQDRWVEIDNLIRQNVCGGDNPANYLIVYHIIKIVGSPPSV